MKPPTPIPSYFFGFRSLADKSLRLTFDTQELSVEAQNDLLDRAHQRGHLIFLEEGQTVDTSGLKLPDLSPGLGGKKSQSKRLRDVLYILWEQLFGADDEKLTFDEFYLAETEKIINHYKNKLES